MSPILISCNQSCTLFSIAIVYTFPLMALESKIFAWLSLHMKSAWRVSVQSAGCEAPRTEQTVDTPHPQSWTGREPPGTTLELCTAWPFFYF